MTSLSVILSRRLLEERSRLLEPQSFWNDVCLDSHPDDCLASAIALFPRNVRSPAKPGGLYVA